MAICIHTGAGAPEMTKVFDRSFSHNLPHVRSLPLFAFRDLVAPKIPETPSGTADWLHRGVGLLGTLRAAPPPTIQRRKTQRWRRRGCGHGVGTEGFSCQYRLYIAAEADEDLAYLLTHIGEDNMIMGSDYGPQIDQRGWDGGCDAAKEKHSAAVIEKILCDNPRRFYGL